MGAIAFGKMGLRIEATGKTDFGKAQIGVKKQLSGLFQPQTDIESLGCGVQVFLEQALQLAPRNINCPGNLGGRQRMLDMGAHNIKRF